MTKKRVFMTYLTVGCLLVGSTMAARVYIENKEKPVYAPPPPQPPLPPGVQRVTFYYHQSKDYRGLKMNAEYDTRKRIVSVFLDEDAKNEAVTSGDPYLADAAFAACPNAIKCRIVWSWSIFGSTQEGCEVYERTKKGTKLTGDCLAEFARESK